MSDELFIILQGALAFGAPLTLAFFELYKLRRPQPAPIGGGDPNIISFKSRTKQPVETKAAPLEVAYRQAA